MPETPSRPALPPESEVLLGRVREYLSLGGLWNPGLVVPQDAVRDLIQNLAAEVSTLARRAELGEAEVAKSRDLFDRCCRVMWGPLPDHPESDLPDHIGMLKSDKATAESALTAAQQRAEEYRTLLTLAAAGQDIRERFAATEREINGTARSAVAARDEEGK